MRLVLARKVAHQDVMDLLEQDPDQRSIAFEIRQGGADKDGHTRAPEFPDVEIARGCRLGDQLG